MRNKLSLRNPDERGAALLEFSLVFGLFVYVLYALIAFGFMLSLKNSITHAAAEGARAAIAADPADRTTVAKDATLDALDWLGSKIHDSDVVATEAACPADVTRQCVTVEITYPYEARPLVPPAPGLGLVTPTNFKASATVEMGS